MPRLIDFFIQPWKIFGVLFGSAATQTTLTPNGNPSGAATTASSALCQFRDVGGGDWLTVCRAFGYEMPALIFWASLGIFAIFGFTLLVLVRETRTLSAAMNDFQKALTQVSASKDELSGSELQELGDKMAKVPALQPAWYELRDRLIFDENKKPVTASRPMSEILSREAVFGPLLSTQFYTVLPGILTGLGLLMTFVAILDGLSHVSVTATMDVKGIAGLINGLSGKFFSSVVAVSSAVSFTLLERILLRRAERTHAQILRFFQARVRAYPKG